MFRCHTLSEALQFPFGALSEVLWLLIGKAFRTLTIRITERDPVSVGFLHTPNFAAFWPKPRKKKDSGTMCWYHANSSPPYPPLADVRLLSKTEKKHREIERFWDNVLVSCKQFSTLPPLQMSGSCPKTEKNIEKSKDFVQNQKTTREIEKNQKNQRFWDNVLVSCKHSVGQIVFFGFFRFLEVSFGFGHNLSISRCFF